MMNTFCEHFFSTTHNKFEPNNIGWSGTTPGRAGSCFYLVGWSDYLLSWWKRSFFPSLRHSRLCGFWLGLVPPPPPPRLYSVFAWGLLFVWLHWGASRVDPKRFSDSVWLVFLEPKQCHEDSCMAVPAAYITALDCWNDFWHALKGLCYQFTDNAVAWKIWGSHRGGTEDLTASIFRVSWTTQKLKGLSLSGTSVLFTNLHSGMYQSSWTFSGIFYLR
jgi:hypothetical protein